MSDDRRSETTNVIVQAKEAGEAHVENVPVSVLQAIYHEVTGKTEKLSRYYSDNYIFEFDDLAQLIQKFGQQLEHYSVIGPTISVRVTHQNRESVTYSSWEKFLGYDSSRVEPVTEIYVRINFAIKLPTVTKHQNYTIGIRCQSLIAEALDDEDDYAPFIARRNSLWAEIEYVDYLVARAFIGIVEEWQSGVRKMEGISIPSKAIFSSYRIRMFGPFTMLLPAFGLCWFLIDRFMVPVGAAMTFGDFAIWGLGLAAILVFSYGISLVCGDYIGDNLVKISCLSAIRLNRGDQSAFKEFGKRRSKYKTLLGFSVTGFLVPLLVSVAAGLLLDRYF